MTINPYEPELAKRKTAFQIAYVQLSKITNEMRAVGNQFHDQLSQVDEALKDYRETAHSLAGWMKRKDSIVDGTDWPPPEVD